MKDIKEFDQTAATSTGGVTGSVRVWSENAKNYFQLKFSILDSSVTRLIKAKYSDRENIGEFIASIAAGSIFRDLRFKSVPTVQLVYEKNKRVCIASEYLKGALEDDIVQTLDEFVKNNGVSLQNHACFVSGEALNPGEVSLESEFILPYKKALAECIVISIIMGDHDLNPGNMLVVTHYGLPNIARIDLGHAFFDLLRAPEFLGGRLKNKEHPVKDFINRDSLAGLQLGAPSKLWRDYPGLVFSDAMVRALKDASEIPENYYKEGIQEAKSLLVEALEELKNEKDYKNFEHVFLSLREIYKSATGINLKKEFSRAQVDAIFEGLENFLLTNRWDAGEVSNLMEIQLRVVELVKNNQSVVDILCILGKEFDKKMPDGVLEWVKDSKEAAPVLGTVHNYILAKIYDHRKEQNPDNPYIKIAGELQGLIQKYLAEERTSEAEMQGFLLIITKYNMILNAVLDGDMNAAVHGTRGLNKMFLNPLYDDMFKNLKSKCLNLTVKMELMLRRREQDLTSEKTLHAARLNQKNFKNRISFENIIEENPDEEDREGEGKQLH